MNFDKAFETVLGHEGKYSNDSRDPGGETNWGISKRSYPGLDIKNLTQADAKAIYKRDYWDKAQCDRLAPGLAFDFFDAAVNSGIGQATRFLQRAVGMADDGHIGPLTLAAIQRVDPEVIQARLNGHRLEFMTRLSTFNTFGKGWSNRIAKNLQQIGN